MGQDVTMVCVWNEGVSCKMPVEVGPYCAHHAMRKAQTILTKVTSSSEAQRMVPRDVPATATIIDRPEKMYVTPQIPHISSDPDFAATIEACDDILRKKGHDYTQGGDRLKNFYSTGAKYDVPAVKVLAIYWDKHMNAIETYLKKGQVESEPIEGRLYDAINYLMLLAKMIRREKREAQEETQKAIDEAGPLVRR